MSEIRHYNPSDKYLSLGKISREDLHHGLFRHTPIESLKIGNCTPSQMRDAFKIQFTENTNYVAVIVLDLHKALPFINQADFDIHVEVEGLYMSTPCSKDYRLSFQNKLDNNSPIFKPQKKMCWGEDSICGQIIFSPEKDLPQKEWMYKEANNELRVSRESGFYIEGAKIIDKNDYVVKIKPWEKKTLQIGYKFPEQSINSTKSLLFKYSFNNAIHTEEISYSPVRPTLSAVLSEVPDSIYLSEDDQYIGTITLKKNNVYESDFENVKANVVNSDLAKTVKLSESEWKIFLKGKSLKQVPKEKKEIKVEFSAKNQKEMVVLTLSDTPSPQLQNKKIIQLKAQPGIDVKIDKQPVAYMPVEKVAVSYTIFNRTNHNVTITKPVDIGTIPPNSQITSRTFVKPEEGDMSIIVLADYMEKQEAKYRIKFREKQEIGVKCEFSLLKDGNVYQDTEYSKKPCGKLRITWELNSTLPQDAYSETKVKIEENNQSDDYSFSFEPSEITIKPTDKSPKEIMVYLSCKPLHENEIFVRYKRDGKEKKSSTPIALLHNDYNIDKLSFVQSKPSNEYVIKDKNPILVGFLYRTKSWTKDEEEKFKILRWENERYTPKTYNYPVESNAIEEEFSFPEGFYMKNMNELSSVGLASSAILLIILSKFGIERNNLQSSSLHSYSVIMFNAYEFFLNNPDKLNKPIEFYVERKWCRPVYSTRWQSKQMPNIKFVDPKFEISVIDAKGIACDKIDEKYKLEASYTEDQKEDLFLRVCQINIKNPSILNDRNVEDLRMVCDKNDLLSLSKSFLRIPLGESSKLDVLMSWSEYKKDEINRVSFEICGSDFESLKCEVELKEDRIDDVYSIDLGTSGIVVGKMRNNISEIIVLNEKDRDNKFETSEHIISSKVFIFDKPDGDNLNGDVIISPSEAKVKEITNEEHQAGSDNNTLQEIFLFCPTKFMVGLEKIPYYTSYVERRHLRNIHFNLNQPADKVDDNDDKQEIIYPVSDFIPEKFVQNVYANIFNRIPRSDRSDTIRKLVLTYPNTYTVEELDKLYEVITKRFTHLKDFIRFVPESDAVVAYFLQKCLDCPEEKGLYRKIDEGKTNVVIYDMGAGTLDLSYVEISKELSQTKNGKRQVMVTAVIKNRIGIPIAGDYLTKIILDGLKVEEQNKYTDYYIKRQADVVKQKIENGRENQKDVLKVDCQRTIFYIPNGKLSDETVSNINKYLGIVVDKAFTTLLSDKITKPDRVVMSGRASLFKPLVNKITEYCKCYGSSVEVGQLESLPDKMKTSVANGALLYNSMFAQSDVRVIKSYNRYHRIGIVYWGINEVGEDCTCYEPIIIPSAADWNNAEERNGMLCLSFSNKTTVDFSKRGYYAFIIECDLPDEDIIELYNQYYRHFQDSEYKKEDLRWAFVNEVKRYRQDGVSETHIEMHISNNDNRLHVNVGNRVAENVITERIEGKPFYDFINK